MARFRIIQTEDPSHYAADITRFWSENLPDTNLGRLQWLSEGNPAGPTVWYLAFDEKKDKLAGAISLMPKTLYLNNRTIRAGIMGDLMVNKKYRVLGPTVSLPKAVVSSVPDLKIEFLYTIPNKDSTKILERNDFYCLMDLNYFVRPINIAYYLEKYLPFMKGRFAFRLINNTLRSFSNAVRSEIPGVFNEVAHLDDSYGDFWSRIQKKMVSTIESERSSQFLNWRYFRNPQFDFRMLTYRSSESEPMSGYLIYCSSLNKIEIFDILALDRHIVDRLLKKIIHIGVSGNKQAIYVMIHPKMPMIRQLRGQFFINAKDSIGLFVPGSQKPLEKNWYFLAGDRNI